MNFKNLLFLFIAIFICGQTFAGQPSFFPITGSKTVSLNGMYYAGLDGTGNIVSNPAGLALLKGKSVELSVFGRLGQAEYPNSNREFFKSFRDDDFNITLGAYWNLFDNFTAGIDYNNGMQYRVNWPFARFLSNDSGSVVLAFEYLNEYNISGINPAVAYNFGPVKVGLTANIMQINYTLGFYQGNEKWNDGIGQAAYQVKYEQDAWAYGFTLGLHTDVSDNFSLGFVLRSSVSASLEGDAETRKFVEVDSSISKTSVTSDFELPWQFGLGGIYKLSDNLTLNIDALYSLWESTQESMMFEFGNQTWNDGMSEVDSLSGYTGNDFLLKFNNSFNLGFGLEYSTSSNIKVRFGYRYSQTPNSEETYSMLFPSVDQHWVSVGVGFRFEAIYIDATLAYARGIETEISQNDNFFYAGKYNLDTYLPTVKIKYQF